MKTLNSHLSRFIAQACLLVLLVRPLIGHADPLSYWTTVSYGATNNLNSVIYTNQLFIAVGNAGTILTSPDGVAWTPQTTGTTNNVEGIVYSEGQYLAVCANDTVLTSSNAINWTVYANATGLGEGNDLNGICYGNGQFVAAENNLACEIYGGCGGELVSRIFVSTNGLSWTQSHYTISGTFDNLSYGNGLYEFLLNGGLFRSYDATNWTQTSAGFSEGKLNSLGFYNGQFLLEQIVDQGGGLNNSYIQSSVDGTNWTYATNFPNNLGAGPVCGGQDQFSNNIVAVASGPFPNFVTGTGVGMTNDAWTTHANPPAVFTSMTYGLSEQNVGIFVAVGSSNIFYSLAYPGAIVWTNTAGGNWSDPNNWNHHQVPGQLNKGESLDDVQINLPGTYTVVLDEGVTPNYWDIRSLTLGAGTGNGTQTLSMSNKILYVSPLIINGGGVLTNYGSSFHADITVQNGGRVDSTSGIYFVNPLTVANGGVFNTYDNDTFYQTFIVGAGGTYNSTGSEIYQTGSLTVNAGGTVNIPVNVIYSYGPITNSGTISLQGNGGIYVYNDGSTNYRGYLLNQPGGVINFQGGNGVQGGFGKDRFENKGTIVNTGTSGISASIVDTSVGVISNLNANSTMRIGNITNTLAGTFYATNNATIQFTGGTAQSPLQAGVPLVLGGPGIFQFYTGGLYYPTDIIPKLQLNGGVLELGSNFQGGTITNLTLNGITLTNTLPVANGGLFTVTNSPVYGNFTVQNGGQLYSVNGTFHGGVTIASGAAFTTPGATIDHDGSLTMNGTLSIPVNVLYLYGPMTNSGNAYIDSNGGIYIYNDGSTNYRGYLLNQPSGIFHLRGGNGFQGGFGQDRLDNYGALINTGSSQVSTTFFTNYGALDSLNGAFTLNKVALQPSSSIGLQLNSRNFYGQIRMNNATTLNGALNVTLANGYVPSVGDSFLPVAGSSLSGSFTATNLPPQVAWQTSYGSSGVTVQVTQTGLVPEFTTIKSSAGKLVFNGINGTPGSNYWVLASTNLALPLKSWTNILTNTFDSNGKFIFTNSSTNVPQEFFIIETQ